MQNQIKSHYLAANANSGSLNASLIKFDKKKAGPQLLLCRVGILNAPLLSVCKQIKTTPVLQQKKVDSLLTAFSLEIVFGANCRAAELGSS